MTAQRRMELEEHINELMTEVESKKEERDLLEIAIDELAWDIQTLKEELGE